jgi:hypothetical protein
MNGISLGDCEGSLFSVGSLSGRYRRVPRAGTAIPCCPLAANQEELEMSFKKRFGALLMGLFAVVAMVFSAAPASAGEAPGVTKPEVGAAAFETWFNRGLPGMCLANHHPAVFMFGGCSGQYADQYWQWYGNGQIQNYFSGACLAAHGDSVVFTFDCGPAYADQKWRNYQGRAGIIENVFHQGKCLAAHGDGKVFLFDCHPEYNDQFWY